jgi:hypothetical protein
MKKDPSLSVRLDAALLQYAELQKTHENTLKELELAKADSAELTALKAAHSALVARFEQLSTSWRTLFKNLG